LHNEEQETINQKQETKMGWFKRLKEGITTSTKEKRETPEGLWYKCPSCKKIHTAQDHSANKYVCLECGNHQRLSSKEYFEILFDNNEFTELHENLVSGDPLEFTDTKKYTDRLTESVKKSGLNDALRSAFGKVHDQELVICCMDFSFIGGSMGSVGEKKLPCFFVFCIKMKKLFLIISKSGGERKMEEAF